MAVFDVVAECTEADLGGGEKNFRRANEPLRVIDKTDFCERRGMRLARLPHAERFERSDRAGKKRRGAVIRRRRRRDEQRLRAGRGKRDRGEESRRAAADDRHFGGETVFAAQCCHIVTKPRELRSKH